MNKVETKKHWYDKPLKFVFLLLSLLPFVLLIINYIDVAPALHTKETTTTINGTTTVVKEEETYPFEKYIQNIQDETFLPIHIAMAYTSFQLNGEVYKDTTIVGDYSIYPTFYKDFVFNENIVNLFVNFGEHDLTWVAYDGAIPYFLYSIVVYEVYITFVYILLRIILFLPNVICYLLDWVERRLGKL